MKDIPNTEYIHFQKSTGNYFINKKINGTQYHFGTYKTLKEAIHWRDYFQSNKWKLTERLHHSKSRYIQKLPSGRFIVKKQRNGTSISYGTFDTLGEAEHQVKLCKSFNWDIRLKPFDCMRYIQTRKKADNCVVYRIGREENRKIKFYGTFNSLDDAKFERDLLILCNWDYDALASIDETFDGTYFCNGKWAKGNFIYTAPNGRIDYGTI